MVKAETELMLPQAKECPAGPAATRSWERYTEQIFPRSLQETAVLTPCVRLLASVTVRMSSC